MKLLESIDLTKEYVNDEHLKEREILLEHLKAKGLPSKQDELYRQSGIEKIYEVEATSCAPKRASKVEGACVVFSDGVLDVEKTKLASHMSLHKVKPLEALHVTESLALMAHTLTLTPWRLVIHKDAHEMLTIVHQNFGEKHHSTLDIVVEEGAQATILERYELDGGVLNHANDILVKNNASLVLSRVQVSSHQSYPMTSYHVQVEANARMKSVSVDKGADIGISRWNIELVGKEAHYDFNVLQLTSKKQHLSSLVNMHHNAPNTHSNQLIKQIVQEHSQGVIDATVNVSAQGAGTVAHQLCRSLVLSEDAKAKVHVKPQLEIYIDDLEASHGASVGQLDDNELFYLMSRGFSESQASELLQGAFIREVAEKLPQEHLGIITTLVPEVEYDTDAKTS